jgi:predicted GH43/DUF377 family glycosyl hydrolase
MAQTMITRRDLLKAAPMVAGLCGDQPLATPHKLGKLVVKASGKAGEFDSLAVDCPFVFRMGERYFMTYVGFDGTGYQTGLASSSNLVDWEPEGCILRRNPKSAVTRYNCALTWILRDNDVHSDGKLKKVKGRYVGVYHAYPGAGYETGPAVIGVASTRNLHDWEVDLPSLTPSEEDSWESGGLYKACLVEERGGYYLFYNAKNASTHWREQTGVAISWDLMNWKRYEGNPIIRNGPAGSPDERFASDPCVLKDGDRWAFFYFGLDAKGVARDLLAVGPDLHHPEKCRDILVDVGKPGTVDSKYAHKPSIITHDGDLYHFYCAVSMQNGKEVRGISVARSRAW